MVDSLNIAKWVENTYGLIKNLERFQESSKGEMRCLQTAASQASDLHLGPRWGDLYWPRCAWGWQRFFPTPPRVPLPFVLTSRQLLLACLMDHRLSWMHPHPAEKRGCDHCASAAWRLALLQDTGLGL